MVWPGPRTSQSHDPIDWIGYLKLVVSIMRDEKKISRIFASHRLVHNNRKIVKIVVSKECNGAFAVVDVDTSWQRISDGKDFH
jgi:hypothetical protein